MSGDIASEAGLCSASCGARAASLPRRQRRSLHAATLVVVGRVGRKRGDGGLQDAAATPPSQDSAPGRPRATPKRKHDGRSGRWWRLWRPCRRRLGRRDWAASSGRGQRRHGGQEWWRHVGRQWWRLFVGWWWARKLLQGWGPTGRPCPANPVEEWGSGGSGRAVRACRAKTLTRRRPKPSCSTHWSSRRAASRSALRRSFFSRTPRVRSASTTRISASRLRWWWSYELRWACNSMAVVYCLQHVCEGWRA